MARTELAVQDCVVAGLNPTMTAAIADGHAFVNLGENIFLYVDNGGGSAVAVTIETPGTVDGNAIADLSVSVPAGESRFIGPFKRSVYNQDDSAGDTGLDKVVFVDTDIQTSVTYAAVKVFPA